MEGSRDRAAYKTVERVLTGAVSKVLSQLKSQSESDDDHGLGEPAPKKRKEAIGK